MTLAASLDLLSLPQAFSSAAQQPAAQTTTGAGDFARLVFELLSASVDGQKPGAKEPEPIKDASQGDQPGIVATFVPFLDVLPAALLCALPEPAPEPATPVASDTPTLELPQTLQSLQAEPAQRPVTVPHSATPVPDPPNPQLKIVASGFRAESLREMDLAFAARLSPQMPGNAQAGQPPAPLLPESPLITEITPQSPPPPASTVLPAPSQPAPDLMEPPAPTPEQPGQLHIASTQAGKAAGPPQPAPLPDAGRVADGPAPAPEIGRPAAPAPDPVRPASGAAPAPDPVHEPGPIPQMGRPSDSPAPPAEPSGNKEDQQAGLPQYQIARRTQNEQADQLPPAPPITSAESHGAGTQPKDARKAETSLIEPRPPGRDLAASTTRSNPPQQPQADADGLRPIAPPALSEVAGARSESRPIASPTQPQPRAASVADVEAPASPRHPLDRPAPKEISLLVPGRTLEGQRQESVEVRLIERSGEVHVAVRTRNPELAASLRQELPALVTRLEQTGYRTETWGPPALGSHNFTELQTPEREAGREMPPGSDQRNSGSPGHNPHQQRREPQAQPQWVEALERCFDRQQESLRSFFYGLAS